MPLLPIPNPVTGVVNAISDGAGDRFKDMVVSLSKMVIEGAAWVFGQLIERINASTTPDLSAGWYKNGPYQKMLGVAVFLTAIMLVLGICHAVASGDPGGVLRRVIVEAPKAVLGITVLVALTKFGLDLTDALSNELMAGSAGPVKQFVKTMTERSTRELALSPAVVMGLSAFVMLIGSLVIWAELLIRSALIYLLVALAPVAIAARLWTPTKDMSQRVTQYLAGFVVAKLIVALCLSIGLGAINSGSGGDSPAPAAPGTPAASVAAKSDSAPTPQDAEDLGLILMGAALVGLAAFSPFTAIKLMPVAENAAHQQGVKGGPGRAVTTAASAAVLARSVTPKKGG